MDNALENACSVFRVPKLSNEQEKASKNFYGQRKRSVKFAHRIWQVLNIVIVISPLVSLIKNQANYLRARGIKAESIGDDKTVNLKIENGECNIVYASPQSLLGNGWWTNMLYSDVYKQNVIGIVVDEARWSVLFLFVRCFICSTCDIICAICA